MRCFIGIDLGSTTTKAIVLDEQQTVLGRGITNSRSNYGIAADVAKQEAFLDARFFLFRKLLHDLPALTGHVDDFLENLEQDFRLQQYLDQLNDLRGTCIESASDERLAADGPETRELLTELFRQLGAEAVNLFGPGSSRKSDFFRDIAGSQYSKASRSVTDGSNIRFESMLNIYDRSIIDVENRITNDTDEAMFMGALERTCKRSDNFSQLKDELRVPMKTVLDTELEEAYWKRPM